MASAPQALYRSACRTLTQKVGGVALPASAVGEGGGGSLGTVAHPEREQSPEVDGEASGFSTVARPTAFNFLNPKPPGSVTLAQVSEQERSGSRGLRPASTLMTPPMAAPLPCRGTAYQPRARPWGSQGPEAPRFEGTPHGDARPGAGLIHRDAALLQSAPVCGPFYPGRCPGLVCQAPVGLSIRSTQGNALVF